MSKQPKKESKVIPEEEQKAAKLPKPRTIKAKTSNAQIPYLDIVAVNVRGMCTGDNYKSHSKNKALLNCFGQFEPSFRNQNRVLMLSEVKANVQELQELLEKDAGSYAWPGHKKKVQAGGAAIIMLNSHHRRPHLFSQ